MLAGLAEVGTKHGAWSLPHAASRDFQGVLLRPVPFLLEAFPVHWWHRVTTDVRHGFHPFGGFQPAACALTAQSGHGLSSLIRLAALRSNARAR